MIAAPWLLTRIALFSALCYVLSWAFAALPNVNPVFFVIFTAGYLWGATPGMLVGLIGMGLWTGLNPYGPALWPVALAQMGGASMSGLIGAGCARVGLERAGARRRGVIVAVAAVVCSIAFYLPVNAADAWVFQPFWPRFAASTLASALGLATNIVIFVLLLPVTLRLYERERSRPWRNRHLS